jgi:hypothetical protein
MLKIAIISKPILKYFDLTNEITIKMDALDHIIRAICSQPDDANILYPLGYYSQKLKSTELNYNIHDKELLAIVKVLSKWDIYCKSILHIISILLDHKNLEY